MNINVYCLIGVEFNMAQVPGNIHILGVFTDEYTALKAREKKFAHISFVDIVETTLDKINENVEERCLNVA